MATISLGVVSLAGVRTVVYRVDPLHPDREIIARCAEVIKRGGLVAFPTETVYGLGANALSPEAVAKVFEAKGRPKGNPLIVHISNLHQVDPLVTQVSPKAEALMKMFWPGPLTLLFPKSDLVLDIVTAGLPNVAIRMPDHPVCKALIDACGLPLVAPSANLSGRPSPTSAQDVLADLDGKVDIILDGGPTHIGVESTVLDVSKESPIILRPGAIGKEDLEAALESLGFPSPVLVDGGGSGSSDGSYGPESQPQAPASNYKHYVPKAELYLATGTPAKQRQKMIFHALKQGLSGVKVAVLASQENFSFFRPLEDMAKGFIQVLILGSRSDLSLVATRLYAAIRRAEELGAKVILSETFGLEGIGLAIANRLEYASQGRNLPWFGEDEDATAQPDANLLDKLPWSEGDVPAQVQAEIQTGPQPEPAGRPEETRQAGSLSLEPLNLLMVCTGNTCRSPMAEGIFRKSWKEAGEPYPIQVSSAGVATVPGLPASKEAIQSMKSMDVDISGHRSAPVSYESLERADLVIAMTKAHKQALLARYPEFGHKMATLAEILPEAGGDVTDPYGKSQEEYDKTAKILEKSIKTLVRLLSGQ
ncbi:MAG: L-threonylcarbamoyladenylate synthase [Bacillota bacterium]|nr:threonylcarbamoyl-AMP synthase [Candidatus Fermentithermobacillaceae bacterium]